MIEITNNHIYCIAQYLHRNNKTISYIYSPRLSKAQRVALCNSLHRIKDGTSIAANCTPDDWCEAYCILKALRKLKLHAESLKYADLSDYM